MDVTIRRLVPEDHAAWTALWNGYTAFYRVTLPEAVTANTWLRLLADSGPVWGRCAVQDGALTGFVTWQIHHATWTTAVRVYLEDLFVAEAIRGQGVGRALIETVYAEADRVGADNVYWFTNHDNETARRLYDRIGVHPGAVKYQRR